MSNFSENSGFSPSPSEEGEQKREVGSWKNDIINIGTGEDITIAELARLVKSLFKIFCRVEILKFPTYRQAGEWEIVKIEEEYRGLLTKFS